MKLRQEILNVVESPLVKIATVAESMPGSIKLCYGESDMPTPEFICRARIRGGDGGSHVLHAHGRIAGVARGDRTEDLRAAGRDLSAVGSHEHRRRDDGDQRRASGARRPRRQRGDHFARPTPSTSTASSCRAASLGWCRSSRSGQRFSLDLDRLERAIDRHTRVLVVNSPSNPTGWMISEAEQRALARDRRTARRRDSVG